ncbi:MAG: hypothetical protein AAFR47_09575 [Pseudomonadota bacterium]
MIGRFGIAVAVACSPVWASADTLKISYVFEDAAQIRILDDGSVEAFNADIELVLSTEDFSRQNATLLGGESFIAVNSLSSVSMGGLELTQFYSFSLNPEPGFAQSLIIFEDPDFAGDILRLDLDIDSDMFNNFGDEDLTIDLNFVNGIGLAAFNLGCSTGCAFLTPFIDQVFRRPEGFVTTNDGIGGEIDFRSLEIGIEPVPLPASLALLTAALTALFWRSIRTVSSV